MKEVFRSAQVYLWSSPNSVTHVLPDLFWWAEVKWYIWLCRYIIRIHYLTFTLPYTHRCLMPFIIFQSCIHVKRRNQTQKKRVSGHQEENYPAQISSNCFQSYLPWFPAGGFSPLGFRNAGNLQPEGEALHQQALPGMVLLANSLQLYCACSTH